MLEGQVGVRTAKKGEGIPGEGRPTQGDGSIPACDVFRNLQRILNGKPRS